MKKIIIFLLPVAALLISSCKKDKITVWYDDSPIIEFQDPRFLKALMEISDMYGDYPHADGNSTYTTFKDMNGDGKVSENEAARVQFLDLNGYKIRNLDELKHFQSLEILYCQNNAPISGTINIGKNSMLKEFNCMSNGLSSLDLDKNTALETINCSNNDLGSLDVTPCKELKSLDCSNNKIRTLNVSECVQLTSLNCSRNLISTLDLGRNKLLENISITDNPIESIIVNVYYSLPESFIDSYSSYISYVE